MPQDMDRRLSRLLGLGILDTPPERRFDRITRIASELLNTPIALVSLIDSERQWFKSRVGLDISETHRSAAFCAHAIEQGPDSVMVVEDARADPRFANNPFVSGEPGIRFYAGATLTTSDGVNLGTLCVIDRKQRPRPSTKELDLLRELAAIVVDEMELSRTVREADRRLALLKLSEAMSGVGFWRYDTVTTEVAWSDQVYAIYGVSPDSFIPNLEAALDSYHPEDRPILDGYIERAMTTGEGYSFELRLKRADGEWRHVTAKANAETDAAGKTIALNGVFQDITEDVRIRERIAESEARYKLLADASSDVVLKIGLGADFEYASPSIKQFGWKSEDLVGEPVARFIHPDDVGRVRTAMAAILTGDADSVSTEQEFRIRKGDGSFVWVEARRTIVRGKDGSVQSLVSQLRDISERHEATTKLTASEARYRMLADNTTDIIGRVSLEGVIRYVSPAIYRLTGYAVEDMVGRKSSEFTHPDDIAGVVAAFRERMSGTSIGTPIRYRIRHKDSREWIWVEANPRLVVGSDGATEFIDIMRDVRQQVALEASMRDARTEAEAGSRAKAEFLANMSHEIRTPLNGVVGYAAVLVSSPELPSKLRRCAEIISTSSKALIRIVDDVLDFSALDTNSISFEVRAFDMRELLRATAETLQMQASGKQIDLQIGVDPRLPPRLLGDESRIRQVLINLIGNAIKFTAAGSVDVRCESIVDSSGQTLRCTVEDTGIGIPANKLNGLFSRFNQTDSTISRRFGGSGLGLAITEKIVTAMGGTVGVSSEDGVGSIFWFTLPLPAVALMTSAANTAALERPTSLQHRRILVVDDHDVNRELAAVLLAPFQHEIVLAASGDEALRLVQREAFDLVFMDVQMPGMDGLDATRAIRALEIGGTTPIVALTAHAMRHQIDECLEAGMDGHIAKPFTAHALQTAILKWSALDQSAPLTVAGTTDLGPEIAALRERFIERVVEDIEKLRQLVRDPSPPALALLKSIIHRLAGTTGSLGFHEAGDIALTIDAALVAGETLEQQDLDELIAALSSL